LGIAKLRLFATLQFSTIAKKSKFDGAVLHKYTQGGSKFLHRLIIYVHDFRKKMISRAVASQLVEIEPPEKESPG